MRNFIVFALTIGLLGSCQQESSQKVEELEERIATLETALSKVSSDDIPVPSLATYMLNIQAHHAKLFYAGEAENWELVHYNIHELEEYIEEVQKVHPTHNGIEIAELAETLLEPGIEQVEEAEDAQSLEAFRTGFKVLTAGCNNCHEQAGYTIINIQEPNGKEYGNQDFN